MTATTLLHRPDDLVQYTFIVLAGDIDIATAGQVRTVIGAAMGGPGTTVVLDTTAVTFIDCAGLRELLTARARLLAGGRFLRLEPSTALTRLLEWTDTTGAFEMHTAHPNT